MKLPFVRRKKLEIMKDLFKDMVKKYNGAIFDIESLQVLIRRVPFDSILGGPNAYYKLYDRIEKKYKDKP